MHNPAGFVLLTDEKYIQYFLDTFKSDEDITYKKLNEFFGHKMDRENGKRVYHGCKKIKNKE